jgi:hypothetical protein
MDISELREALTAILEKLDSGSSQSESETVVTFENADGAKENLDLWTLTAGALVKVCGAEYMKILPGEWVKYTGEKLSSEELANRARNELRNDGRPRIVHFG